jgi:hypothetical protein
MKASHGVIQGYNGIAVVDSKRQVIVSAEAHSEGQDQHLLKSSLEGTKETLQETRIKCALFSEDRMEERISVPA